MILTCIKSGIARMWENKRMVFVFYFANLFFGLILMLPFRSALSKFVGHSLMGAKLRGRLDMDFVFEFLKYNKTAAAAITGLILIVTVVYWLFALFLSGGAFSIFATGVKYTPILFWGSAAKYFGCFIRLVLWSVPVFIILFCLQFLWTAIERLLFGSDPYQYITFWGDWIKVGLRYFSIFMFGLVLDYARIHAVMTDERIMIISLWQGVKFIFGNFLQTFGLALFLFVVGALVVVIYNSIANLLSAPEVLVVILLFILQQIYIFFRMMLRLTLYSSQLHLYIVLSTGQESSAFTSTDNIETEDVVA